jgi:hypothetical protein
MQAFQRVAMSDFIFIAGSETHPNAWDATRGYLERRGFSSTLIDWSDTSWSLGFDSAVNHFLKDVAIQPESVLVGHSIAGLFLPLVADAIKARCEIYLSALPPRPKLSFFDQLLANEEPFHREWAEGYGEMSRSKEPKVTHRWFLERFLFHDCGANAMDLYWNGMQESAKDIYITSYPAKPLPDRRRSYIVCSQDRALRPEWQHHAAFDFLGVQPVEIASGHCPHLAMPQELAHLLEELSEIHS